MTDHAPVPAPRPDTVRDRAAAVFDLDARLPAQVFRELADEAVFYPFDTLLTPDAWPALTALAGLHGDRRIDLLVVAADGDVVPALSLPVDATPDDYWARVGFEEDGDAWESVTIAARTVALTGPSGRWGCWGERDPEVAVLRGFPGEAARRDWCARHGPALDVAGVLGSWLRPVFRDRRVPAAYAAELTAHYGASRRPSDAPG
ncbi:hypothetical protein [Streptomyces sp. NPDC090025]|uniref:hypothetical protein n=1 Tax=Streptomyces sp. NPDC090025 TaxID=3365922 RepID=UPI003832D113